MCTLKYALQFHVQSTLLSGKPTRLNCNTFFNCSILSLVYHYNTVMYMYAMTLPLAVDKHGCLPEDCVSLARHIIESCPHLKFSGLMTIGALARSLQAGKDDSNPDFMVCPVAVCTSFSFLFFS